MNNAIPPPTIAVSTCGQLNSPIRTVATFEDISKKGVIKRTKPLIVTNRNTALRIEAIITPAT